MNPFTPHGAGQWLVVAASVLVAVGVIWNKGIKPAWVTYRRVTKAARAIHDLIERELTTNGGASMKDQANLAARKAEEAAQAAAFLSAQLGDVQATQDATFEVLDTVVRQKGLEHDEIWAALLKLGVDRRGIPPAPDRE